MIGFRDDGLASLRSKLRNINTDHPDYDHKLSQHLPGVWFEWL